MKKVFGALMIAFAICIFSAAADEEGAKEKKEKKKKPELTEITVTGKLIKQEKTKGEKTRVFYILQDAEGNSVRLFKQKSKKNDAEGTVNFEDYIDSEVTITGMGIEKERKGKKLIIIRKITKIEKVEAGADN